MSVAGRAGAKQICCEQISFLFEGHSESRMANTLFANLDSDLPLYLWWQGEFPDPIDETLWAWVDRLIYDSQEWKDVRAQFSLGWMYSNGQSVEQDYSVAMMWYRKAAEQGHVKAQFNLGRMYDKGLGVEPATHMAIQWYRKAAEQGYVTAQFNLGLIYAKNQGEPVDLVQACKWFNLAATAHDETARIYMEEFEKVMSSEQIDNARILARQLQNRVVAL